MSTSVPDTLSAALVRDWAHTALAALGSARAHIDALNVFPVPDGDTGTNLYFTVEAAALSVDACCEKPTSTGVEAARALATGALLGARGNSGVILSQILRGVGEGLDQAEAGLDGEVIHRILRRGADLAYEAVAHPVEGTILTVMRSAAEGAERALGAAAAEGRSDAAAVMDSAVRAAEEALDLTPTMLEALRLAGVVDAGGQGLVVVLRSLADVIRGGAREWQPLVAQSTGDGAESTRPSAPFPADGGPGDGGPGYQGPAYEVMFLFDAADDAVPDLRARLDALGDSLVVVGGDRLWNVHVHVDDAGAAIEAAMELGRPFRIRVTHLQTASGSPSSGAGALMQPGSQRSVVAVSHGPGVAQLLSEADIVIVPARANVRPSTAELLAAIGQAHASEVVILPSDKDTTAVAEIAAEEARGQGLRISVIPTRSIVQTLAAVAVHDPLARFDDDVVAMTRAAGATRYGAITVASRDALTTAGPCRAGDILGLVDGDIGIVGADLSSVTHEMIAGMLAIGGELITLVFGGDADEQWRTDVAEWVAEAFPLIDVVTYDGGQPLWPLILGVE